MATSKLDKAFIALDELFIDQINKYDFTFEEIDLLLYRLHEKIFEQKIIAIVKYAQEGEKTEEKKPSYIF